MRRTNYQKPQPKHVGEIRTSQLITSYGVGAMVDFKEETVILAEADGWFFSKEANKERIIHCRSLEKVLQKNFFVMPKWDPNPHPVYESKKYKSKDIAAYRFPTILYCPNCKRLVMSSVLAGNRTGAPKCREEDCNGSRLIPSRFIVACPHGHLDDFPYDAWVHHAAPCPARGPEDQANLRLKNAEGRNSIGSLTVFCDDCGAYRSMYGALTAAGLKSVYACTGRRPWLKIEYEKGKCKETPVTKSRTAAGVYMPATVSALNLPAWTTKTHQVLQGYLEALEDRTEEQALDYINKKIVPSLHGVDADEILSVWKQMTEDAKTQRPRNEQELYEDEYAALCEESTEQDFEEDDDEEQDFEFYSEEQEVPAKYSGLISRIFAVPRLTEVVVMLGFTRLFRWDGDYRSSALAPIFSQKEREWLPAVELHGEGIFIELKEELVQAWEEQNRGVYQEMMQAAEDNRFREENASPRYVLLHTLAHLLIRALSVNCGYQAASMKERIYATYRGNGKKKKAMSGILIYTTAADTDGSLGGLVSQAAPENMETHLDALLNEAGWCSSDPLCMSAYGKNAQGLFGMNYAACPQCTLLPETSCSARNSLLDRGALIGREEDGTVGYFTSLMGDSGGLEDNSAES